MPGLGACLTREAPKKTLRGAPNPLGPSGQAPKAALSEKQDGRRELFRFGSQVLGRVPKYLTTMSPVSVFCWLRSLARLWCLLRDYPERKVSEVEG